MIFLNVILVVWMLWVTALCSYGFLSAVVHKRSKVTIAAFASFLVWLLLGVLPVGLAELTYLLVASHY